ncbi:Scr1 family TA system antitoxin-like transcriptional regulator [Streptomyces violaceoruber]
MIPACPRTTSTSPAVARRQSEHLLRISDSENVNLRVIPFKAGKADHLLQG